MKLTRIGFCCIDDTTSLEELLRLSSEHPRIEWGVALLQHKEGQPRYASREMQVALGHAARSTPGFQLAVHLCGEPCLRALAGDADYLQEVHARIGFHRVQLNATAVNGAGDWETPRAVSGIRTIAAALPAIEFILQLNEETRPLFVGLFESSDSPPPTNLAVLFDTSLGRGTSPTSWPAPIIGLPCGYAGGFGPRTVLRQLDQIQEVCEHAANLSVWIDMESGIRTRTEDGRDFFDLEKVEEVLALVTQWENH